MEPEALTSVAVYRRRVNASLERVLENVHDWEHLPWLHRTSFGEIELLDRDAGGWHARVWLQPREADRHFELELRFAVPRRRYVSRTLEGPGKGSEIWTDMEPVTKTETDIRVEFLLPGLQGRSEDELRTIGDTYTALYQRLWDEDEAMMTRREGLQRLRGGSDSSAPVDVGTLDEVRAGLPLLVDAGGRTFRIVSAGGSLVAHGTVCPHMLGPLDTAPVEDGCVRCPWHGYRFDVHSGQHADGGRLQLDTAALEVDASGRVRLFPRS